MLTSIHIVSWKSKRRGGIGKICANLKCLPHNSDWLPVMVPIALEAKIVREWPDAILEGLVDVGIGDELAGLKSVSIRLDIKQDLSIRLT